MTTNPSPNIDLERGNSKHLAMPDVTFSATPTLIHEPTDLELIVSRESLASELAPELERVDGQVHPHPHDRHVAKSSDTEKRDSSVIYVDFEENDPRNPFHFSRTKKWIITLILVAYTGNVAALASTIAFGNASMMRDLNCTSLQAAAALAMYNIGFGIAPLFLASFSEEFGRNPVYIASAVILWIFILPIALSKNIATVIICRFICGMAGSTGSTLVGGSIADIWHTHERGLPMSIFGFSAIVVTGLAPLAAGWIETNTSLEWRWIQWLHFIVAGIFVVLMALFLRETRGSVILAKEAGKLRKETGDDRYQPRVTSPPLKTLVWIALTRPLYLLVTEPVVAAFSLWVGFAWGVLFGVIESVGLVFSKLYGFNAGQTGTACLSISVGAVLGFITIWYQEKLYIKNFARKGPEARLYAACGAGLFLPIGCFIYAWTSFSNVHWMGPIVGITLVIWGIYIIYNAAFNYLADSYLIYASSALAGQSLCRNFAAFAFPMFVNQMYEGLGFNWASSLIGFISIGLTVIPFGLFVWGPKIRARSRFAKKMAELEKVEPK